MEDSFKPITADPGSSRTYVLPEYRQKDATEYSSLMAKEGRK